MKFCKDCKWLKNGYCTHQSSETGGGIYMMTGEGEPTSYFQAWVMRESEVDTRCGKAAKHFEPIEQQSHEKA